MSSAVESPQDSIYVSFRLGQETYGIGIDDVKQIIRLPHITRVPKMPSHVLGMSNLRGEVMPLTDLSLRLGYQKPCENTDDTRVIVVEKEGTLNGFVVESVSEVKSTEIHQLDAFPEMLNAEVDKRYISGIMKINQGGNVLLIQILNTDEIIDITALKAQIEKQGFRKTSAARSEEAAAAVLHEKRFISFNIGQLEYAVEIHRINEIIWMPEVTAIPGLPDYVLGIFSLRGRVIPLISLHDKFGRKHSGINENSRVIIVDINNVMVAFAADKVNAVLSVEENLIEEPPKAFTEDTEEIAAVLKLEKGERLVMALEPKNIVNKTELEALSRVAAQSAGDLTMAEANTHSKDDEKQIVTFQIENEQYGILIEKVQEINRYTNVTKVPKTPKFVEGIINLRGEVIPLIDLRTRFDLKAKERDEFTRVIIVNLKNMKVGFVVDGVDEVLRIKTDDIDVVPPVLSATVSSEFIGGVVNVVSKQKMILLLNIEDLFSHSEMSKLEKMKQE
ncbi:chemotaxis protein CheW [Seleniivibrio woodruffii]|uniref:chemotaxis protein CheW n=1 Tax=Seleniivibrio woodruffii TaxID=1078050 RepID=UPI0026EEF36A|nr:chemotaxis protein CheW [Seleniivibrio woodruffii]